MLTAHQAGLKVEKMVPSVNEALKGAGLCIQHSATSWSSLQLIVCKEHTCDAHKAAGVAVSKNAGQVDRGPHLWSHLLALALEPLSLVVVLLCSCAAKRTQ